MTPPRRSLLLLLQTGTLLLFPFSVNAIFSGYNTVFFFFLFGRKKSSSTAPKAKKAKTDKKSKDPNAPKRPQTAFFLFMYTISQSLSCTFGLSFRVCVCCNVFNFCVRDDFRKTYKEENPDSKGGKEVQVFINYCPCSLFFIFC